MPDPSKPEHLCMVYLPELVHRALCTEIPAAGAPLRPKLKLNLKPVVLDMWQ